MHAPTVLISGAGIAGMSLASLLSRAGYRVTVVERAPSLRGSGYSIDFRGDALDVLDRLGIHDQTEALTTSTSGTRIIDAEGATIDRLPMEAFGGDLEVPKKDFTQLLHRSIDAHVEIVFDETITALSSTADGVRADFASRPAQTFSLVFGADGVYSRVRRLCFAPHERVVRALGMSGAGFSTRNTLGLDHEGLLMPGEGAVIYAFSDRDPERLTVSLSFAADGAGLDRAGRAAQEDAVRTAFAGVGWEAPRLLHEMAAADDFYFASAVQVELETWSSDRIALLGDAGYCAAPTSGMGTSQALLGARSLADHLTHRGDDHRAAFHDYEHELRPRILENQSRGRAAVGMFTGSAEPEVAPAS